jgi:lysophospholipase L1-like esterase
MILKNSVKSFLLITILAFINILTAQATVTDTAKKNLNIVFIGNSITHGAGLKDWKTEAPPNEAVKYLMQQPGVGVVNFANQGYSGHTTVDFLPATNKDFPKVEAAARAFVNKNAQLVFSIILGTNDSAVNGPNGSPVSKEDYLTNLQTIISQLLKDFPGCKVIIQQPTWYSPNTHNHSTYMQEGLTRLQTYFPQIKAAVKSYAKTNHGRVFRGDTNAFGFFKKNAEQYFQHENGQDGVFYLHPNKEGAVILGDFWAKAIYKHLFK